MYILRNFNKRFNDRANTRVDILETVKLNNDKKFNILST